MGSFLSSETINADNRDKDKEGEEENSEKKKEGNSEKESVRTSKKRVPNQTTYVYKRNKKRKNKKKDF